MEIIHLHSTAPLSLSLSYFFVYYDVGLKIHQKNIHYAVAGEA